MNRLLVLACVLVSQLVSGGCHSLSPVVVEVGSDDAVIDEGTVAKAEGRRVVVRFGAGVVSDANGDGVVHVRASNVVIECEGVLRGSGAGVEPDAMKGTGIRIQGQRGVTVRGLEATGFKVGLRATNADGLTIDSAEFHNLYRMHLKSTEDKEHNDDWLWPHENDRQEWVSRYGAAVCVERSKGVVVSNVRVRTGQNGLVLDRVSDAQVYDNDCSFLSGWGIAMWRSCENLISRNALDFCVRGYSHGKYNRGQDSAGLLMFEQCSRNVVVENSMTHCGDGVLVFAGKEALGETSSSGVDHRRNGCNDNVFARNDCSFAPAHGLEVTFSFGNRIDRNTFEGNAICGVWGGYSQVSLITWNRFVHNGARGAGEGGGINIEHGYRNTIAGNEFAGNSVAVKLWDDDDGPLLKTPWAIANHVGCRENWIADNNVAQAEGAAFVVRGAIATAVTGNTVFALGKSVEEIDADGASSVDGAEPLGRSIEGPASVEAVGVRRPVGARDTWRGREWIRMGEWGPMEPGLGTGK